MDWDENMSKRISEFSDMGGILSLVSIVLIYGV